VIFRVYIDGIDASGHTYLSREPVATSTHSARCSAAGIPHDDDAHVSAELRSGVLRSSRSHVTVSARKGDVNATRRALHLPIAHTPPLPSAPQHVSLPWGDAERRIATRHRRRSLSRVT
jgi:hypothetical protein